MFKFSSLQNKNGQIRAHHQIGKYIVDSCQDIENIIYLEIGTWKGMGSTALFISELEKRTESYYFFTIEANNNFYKMAIKNLKKYNLSNSLFIHGTISKQNELETENLTSEERKWLDEDSINFKSAPDVTGLIPSKIDVLLLDGGEFSTFSEFSILASRLNDGATIILDDTKTRKSQKVLNYIRNNKDYSILETNDERNGVAKILYKTKFI